MIISLKQLVNKSIEKQKYDLIEILQNYFKVPIKIELVKNVEKGTNNIFKLSVSQDEIEHSIKVEDLILGEERFREIFKKLIISNRDFNFQKFLSFSGLYEYRKMLNEQLQRLINYNFLIKDWTWSYKFVNNWEVKFEFLNHIENEKHIFNIENMHPLECFDLITQQLPEKIIKK